MLVKMVLITTVFSMVDLLFDLCFQITIIALLFSASVSLLIRSQSKKATNDDSYAIEM